MGLLASSARQRWHCSGKIQEVKHPETSVHGQLTPQAGREHFFPTDQSVYLPLQGQSEDFWNIYSLQSQMQPS